MNRITENTTLTEVLEKPEFVKILSKHNLPCLGCPFAKLEMGNLTIGEICKMYNIDSEGLIKELLGKIPYRNDFLESTIKMKSVAKINPEYEKLFKEIIDKINVKSK